VEREVAAKKALANQLRRDGRSAGALYRPAPPTAVATRPRSPSSGEGPTRPRWGPGC